MPIPSTGTFKIYPSLFINIASGEYDLQAGTDPVTQQALASREDIAAYYTSEVNNAATCPKLRRVELNASATTFTPAVGTYETQVFLKQRITFDAAGTPTPIDIISADYPLGVRFRQLQVVILGTFESWQDNRQVTNTKLKARQNVVFDLNNLSGTTYVNHISATNSIISSTSQWATNQILGTTLGHVFTVVNNPGGPGASLFHAIQEFYLQGTYNSGWISLSTNVANANPGDTIVISDASGNFDLFTDFKAGWKSNPNATEYTFSTIIPRAYWTKTSTQITLKLPTDIGIPYGQRRFSIFGIVTDPTWPIPTGGSNNELEISRLNVASTLTDGSGIYNLTPGKRNDTYYNRAVSPVGLTNLKIPNPFIKTGFFNG